MVDKKDPGYWISLKSGDFINLTDYQSLSLSGSAGSDYRIGEIRPVEIQDRESELAVAEYRFYEIKGEKDKLLYFTVVTVGEELELRVYYLPRGFVVGTRDQLIDLGHTWFFLPPSDPEDFISSELEYAPFPDVPPIEEDGKTVTREYEPAGFGQPVYGFYRKGREEIPVIMTEYFTTDEEALNPLILILEERWILPDGTVPVEGGLVSPLLGCTVHPDSVETYPAS